MYLAMVRRFSKILFHFNLLLIFGTKLKKLSKNFRRKISSKLKKNPNLKFLKNLILNL